MFKRICFKVVLWMCLLMYYEHELGRLSNIRLSFMRASLTSL
jgi:hypothetical protein